MGGSRASVKTLTPEEEAAKKYSAALAKGQAEEALIVKAAQTAGITKERQSTLQKEQLTSARAAYDKIIKDNQKEGLAYGNKAQGKLFEFNLQESPAYKTAMDSFRKTWGEDIFQNITTGKALPVAKGIADTGLPTTKRNQYRFGQQAVDRIPEFHVGLNGRAVLDREGRQMQDSEGRVITVGSPEYFRLLEVQRLNDENTARANTLRNYYR